MRRSGALTTGGRGMGGGKAASVFGDIDRRYKLDRRHEFGRRHELNHHHVALRPISQAREA